jgi:putative addiction module component (TIGR02574 family)
MCSAKELTQGESESMETSTTDLFKQALDLDERDRATLAGLLIESLEEEPDEDLEAAWRAEVERRVAELESGEVKAVPWEELKAKLLQREHD